jgi:hypothetical protein
MVNPVGRTILLSLEEGSTVDECVATIAKESGVAEERVSTDTRAFIQSLLDRALLMEVH